MKPFLLLTAWLVWGNVLAQDTLPTTKKHVPEIRMTIGVEAGPSLSWIDRAEPMPAFIAGAAVHYNATTFLSVGMGFFFERKALAVNYYAPPERYVADLDYFTIHPMVSFYAGKKVRFVGRVGGFFAIPVNSAKGTQVSFFPQYDGGISIAAGVDFKVHSLLRLRVENRASVGFGKVRVETHSFGGTTSSEIQAWFSNSIVLGVDFLISGSK